MKKEELTKGPELERDSSTATPTRTYNYVNKGNEPVGIGYFDLDSDEALTAIAYDENKKRHVFDELTSKHPVDAGVKLNLEKLFKHHFSG